MLDSPRAIPGLVYIGLLALGASQALIDGTQHYPGARALLPTVAAGALILLGEVSPHNWLSLQLSRNGLVYVGRISYPWYLWHWPLLAIHRDYTVGEQALSAALAIAPSPSSSHTSPTVTSSGRSPPGSGDERRRAFV